MKINIQMEMTPEEVRKVMGLPDVEPMQKEMMGKMQDKMNTYIEEMSDPELFMKRIMPMGIQGMDQVQEFFSRFANMAAEKKRIKLRVAKTAKVKSRHRATESQARDHCLTHY